MKRFSKIALGAIALAVGIGGITVFEKQTPKKASAAAGDTFALVTDVSTLTAGDLVAIGSADATSAYFASTADSGNNRPQTTQSISISSSSIISTAEMEEFTLGGSLGAWTFSTNKYKGTAGYLNASNTTKNNYLQVNATLDNYSYFKIEAGTSNNSVITCTGKTSRNLLRYNSTSKVFSCYTSGQANVYLFKKIVSTTPTIALSSSSIQGIVGGSAISVTSTSRNFGGESITWSIVSGYDTTIATPTVDSNGTISVIALALGSTDITVKATSTSYNATSSFTFLAVGDSFSKVTDLASVKVGSLVTIGNISAAKMISTVVSSTYFSTVDVTINSNSFNAVKNMAIFKVGLGTTKDSYTLQDTATSQYLYATGSSYGLSLQATNTTNGEWTMSLNSSSNVTVTSIGASAAKVITYYSNTSVIEGGSSASGMGLYINSTNAGDVDSISIEGSGKTAYSEGDTFDSTGLTVSASFADADTSVISVTNWVTWAPTTLTASTTAVTASFTFAGVTKTADFAVTVTAKVLSSIAITTPANKLVFGVGETLDITGLVVTATYGDGSTADITSACAFTPASGSTLATAGSVTVTAAFGGKAISYEISVVSITSFAPNFTITPSAVNAYSKGYIDSQNRWSLVYSSTLGAKVMSPASGLQQVGSKDNPVDSATIESGLFVSASGESKITKVVFTFNGASSSSAATVSVKVGGVSFGSSQSFSGSTSTDLTFENVAGAFGHIQISITSVIKGLKFGTIKVYSVSETSDAASANAFAHDLELANGCATDTTYDGLKTKYDALSASAKTIADALTIDDLADGSTTDIVLGRCTVAEKMAVMKNRAGSGSGAFTLANDAPANGTWIVATLSVVAIASAGFFLLRKRKEQR